MDKLGSSRPGRVSFSWHSTPCIFSVTFSVSQNHHTEPQEGDGGNGQSRIVAGRPHLLPEGLA